MSFGFMTIGTQRTPITGLWIEGGDLIVRADLRGPLFLPAPVTITGDDGVPIGGPLSPAFTDDLTGQPLQNLDRNDTMVARIRVRFKEITVAGAA
jgi:hypothetical protein